MRFRGRAAVLAGALAGTVLLCAACVVVAQTNGHNSTPVAPSAPTGPYGRTTPGITRSSDYGFPDVDPAFSHRQMVSRRDENYRRMLDNASKLQALTHDLQEDLRTHGADADETRRLDEIAKLARAVRDGMRQ